MGDVREAEYWEKLDKNRVHCVLCPQNCRIPPGKAGFCRIRVNQDGTLYAAKYGRCASYAMDPVEKKPLYHFHPGTYVFSLGAFGCNLRCLHCQNWELSQGDGEDFEISPEEAVNIAEKWHDPRRRCVGLAYTYSEPLVWYEMVRDTAKIAHERGLKNVLVTNGFVQAEPLRDLLPYIDAMNVDVKGFTNDFYRSVCSARLAPVLRTVEIAHGEGCHVEITTLLIPDLNDGPEEIGNLVEWLAGVSPDIPLHFSRYFPNYKMTRPATPLESLKRARDIARQRLHFVYVGNAWEIDASETTCPSCGNVLVRRDGYDAEFTGGATGPEGVKCQSCGSAVNIRNH